MTRTQRSAVVGLTCLLFALAAMARVISYAPYTDRSAYPAHQLRTNRYFVLVEAAPSSISAPTPSASYGQLVIYDSTGQQAPRVIFPQAPGTSTVFTLAAVRESDGVPTILLQAADSVSTYGFYLSTDGGTTWKKLDLPGQTVPQILATGVDTGGPYAVSRYARVRIGTKATPFVLVSGKSIYAVNADATTRVLYQVQDPAAYLALAGSDQFGTQFIVRNPNEFVVVGLDGTTRSLGSIFPGMTPNVDGFIAGDGSVYLDERSGSTGAGKLWIARAGSKDSILDVSWNQMSNTGFPVPSAFMIPTADYSGAWIIKRFGGPTILYKHTPTGGLVKQWEDITAPEVEALHAGNSGNKVLIQVHRARPAVDQRIFMDPALAVWRVGDPAPRAYDELYMNEQWNKGFVHLDVEKIEGGEPFVFDSGTNPWGGMGGGVIISPPPAAGGGDVTQEWGVVRASLKQRLVLPSIGRVKGNFGSDWATDVIVQNPLDTVQEVPVSFLPDCAVDCTMILVGHSLVLQPHETHLYSDALKTIFNFDTGTGAMVFDPPAGITVTSRTYSKTASGTFGFGMNAVDAYAGTASPRFPVSFAGAFPGTNFRTNMTLTDVFGGNSEVMLTGANRDGFVGPYDITAKAGGFGHTQINGVTGMVGLSSSETGALVVQPKNGSVIASVFAIDNRTNDSTYFAPDLPSTTTVRTIPVIGHLDGANNSKFRTDLYLYNPSDQPRSVMLQAKAWDVPEGPATLNLTLLGHEARVIKDALFTVFGKTGFARLRYSGTTTDSSGVRVTSRTYNVDPNGGTYGFITPPLNNFQIGGGGDTLEILGAVADPKFRVNVGLVELNGWPTGQNVSARIEIVDSTGKQVDSFSVNVASAGGTQLNDIFTNRGLTITGPVLIRVSPATGTIGAYATMTDNGTNDSVYLAANLAAKD